MYMKDNKQLNQLVYLKPAIELVRIQQEQLLLTGSDDDGPGVVVEPSVPGQPTPPPTPNPGGGGFDITVDEWKDGGTEDLILE
jgi:hypothetical protein